MFVLGLAAWNTNRGVFAAALAGAIVTGVVWLLWWYVAGPSDLTRLLGTPRLGSIPDDDSSPAPTLTDTSSASSHAYRDVLSAIEGQTNGQVLLVSCPAPGQGASTVALNLAISGTQRGRRIALIDGDVEGNGLSQFLSTGSAPGLTDLASEDSTLADVARLWTIGSGSALPVIPSGTPGIPSETALARPGLAASIDRIAERADTVLIDAPPIAWDGATAPLAAHADGTVLVITERTTESSIADTRDRLAAAGAPVIGYVSNRSKPPSIWRIPVVRMLKRIAVTFAVIAAVYSAFMGLQIYGSWTSVDREVLATSEASAALPTTSLPPLSDVVEDDPAVQPLDQIVVAAPTIEGAYRSLLLIGTDEAADLADVVLLTVLPADKDLAPFMVSLPRDLYVPNRCTNGYGRINTAFRACGDLNAPTMLALAVEDFTGIKVDNLAIFNFEGFAEIIDGVGGVELCSEYPLRDAKAHLDFPGGCVNADGAMALAWVRSRHTQQLVNGSWRSVSGAGDLLRNQHQQEVLLLLAEKLRTFESPTDLQKKISDLSSAFTVDEGLGLGDTLSLAWSLRGTDVSTIERLVVPVKLGRTTKGQSVLRATQPFDEVLAEFYPTLLADETATASPAS